VPAGGDTLFLSRSLTGQRGGPFWAKAPVDVYCILGAVESSGSPQSRRYVQWARIKGSKGGPAVIKAGHPLRGHPQAFNSYK